MNSWLNIPYDCMNFISYASYRNTLRKMVKFWPKIKIPLALDIKNWGFQLKRARWGSRDEKMHKNRSVDRWLGGSLGCHFKNPSSTSFLHVFPLVLQGLCRFSYPKVIFDAITAFWEVQIDFWRLGLWIWDLELRIWTSSPLFARLNQLQLNFYALRVFNWVRFQLVVFISLSTSLVSFSFVILMLPKRETIASRAQGKCPTKSSQPDQMEARRKVRYDTTLFSCVEEYQRYKQKFAKRKVVLGRSINFSQLQYFGFEGLFRRMGWLPIVTIF